MGMNRYAFALILAAALSAPRCYSLKGISVDPETETYSVTNFENLAVNAPNTLAVNFTEQLKDKIRSETRLRLVNADPHLEIGGRVTEYRVVPVAPRPGQESVALNRLEMAVSVYVKNNTKPSASWGSERRFSHFAEFSSTTELFAVQDVLIRQISTQLLDDIFNAVFNEW
jgi:hypothetical protein